MNHYILIKTLPHNFKLLWENIIYFLHALTFYLEVDSKKILLKILVYPKIQ